MAVRDENPTEERDAPQPQPEPREPRLGEPGPTDLSRRDYVAIVKRAVKESIADGITDSAAAIAYYGFTAIPALSLIAVGVFSLIAGQDAINTVVDKVGTVAPQEAVKLLEDSLDRTTQGGGGITLILVGGAIAVWTATGTMTAVMRALNRAYGREESRKFLRQRLAALAMLVFMLLAFVLAFGLLVLGPKLSGWIGDAVGAETVVTWLWWVGQWPILVLALLLAFGIVLYLGPNVEHPRWDFLSIGAVVALVVWLAASGAFAFFVAHFGSYNKAWGALAGVVIMLTWLWVSALALLFGAEVNAEAERSRELRKGEPAEVELQAPPKS